MKFDELRLLIAIHKTGRQGTDPQTDRERLEYALRVRDTFTREFDSLAFPWSVSDVCKQASTWRKSSTTKLKAAIAMAHGSNCFWKSRDKGPCSDEVEAGHVVARSDGADLTVANGMIECRSHNNQRRAQTIEEYLMSADMTYHQDP